MSKAFNSCNGASVSGATLEQLAPEAISPLTIRLHYTGNNGGLSISYMYTISYINVLLVKSLNRSIY